MVLEKLKGHINAINTDGQAHFGVQSSSILYSRGIITTYARTYIAATLWQLMQILLHMHVNITMQAYKYLVL